MQFIATTVSLTALAAVGLAATAPDRSASRAPQFQSEAIIENSDVWILRNRGNQSVCLLEKTTTREGGQITFAPEPDCMSVTAVATRGETWVRKGNAIVVSDDLGSEIMRFTALDDGMTFASGSLRLSPSG